MLVEKTVIVELGESRPCASVQFKQAMISLKRMADERFFRDEYFFFPQIQLVDPFLYGCS